MKIGSKVKHSEYGTGTITHILYEDTKRELFAVEFDVSNSELHDCFGKTKMYYGWFCKAEELEVVE